MIMDRELNYLDPPPVKHLCGLDLRSQTIPTLFPRELYESEVRIRVKCVRKHLSFSDWPGRRHGGERV